MRRAQRARVGEDLSLGVERQVRAGFGFACNTRGGDLMILRISLGFALMALSAWMLLYPFAAAEAYSMHDYSLFVCCVLPVGSPLVAVLALRMFTQGWRRRPLRMDGEAGDRPCDGAS
jgi:hypothetical protein